jgi:uncharacterized protein (DUF3084 family)
VVDTCLGDCSRSHRLERELQQAREEFRQLSVLFVETQAELNRTKVKAYQATTECRALKASKRKLQDQMDLKKTKDQKMVK